MESITRLRKVGGSLVATIPKEIVDFESLMPGQRIKIEVTKIRKSGFGSMKGIGSWTKEDKKWMEEKMASKFVIDASAWIEYFKGSDKGKKIAEVIESDSEMFSSSATIAEVISKSLKEGKDFEIALTNINNWSIIMNLNAEISVLAGKVHFEEKKKNKDFGMLDAFVAATAKKLNAKILTCDSDFKGFKEAVMV